MLDDAPENEFTLTGSVTGVDNLGDVFGGNALLDGGEDLPVSATLCLVLERIRDDGKPVDGLPPILEFRIIVFRELLFDEMADGPRDNEFVAQPRVVGFFCRAKHLGDVVGNAGFLRDDNDGHEWVGPVEPT